MDAFKHALEVKARLLLEVVCAATLAITLVLVLAWTTKPGPAEVRTLQMELAITENLSGRTDA